MDPDQNPISEYQKWKQHGAALRAQAKQAMEARFVELLGEAVQIAQEYQADFGATLKPPAPITAFRFKAAVKGKAPAKKVKKEAAEPAAAVVSKADLDALRKRLDQARKKVEAAKEKGRPTKNLEDRVYEIEDEIRLAGG